MTDQQQNNQSLLQPYSEVELEGGEDNGSFGIGKKRLMDIVHLDAHYVNKEHATYPGQVIISSAMIQEDEGGLEEICRKLNVDPNVGLLPDENPKDAEERRRVFGTNEFPPPHIRSLCELIMENFEDQINQILLGASVVALITGCINEGFPKGMLEGVSIMIALCIIIVVSSGNNYVSEQRLAKLVATDQEQMVDVQRGDKKTTIRMDYQKLLVGDIVHISKGEKIPADCLLIDGQNVSCDEGELTGEPDDINKEVIDGDNYMKGQMCTLMAKSTCKSGFGRGLVVSVGYNTTAGSAALKTQGGSGEKTLLQQKLNRIADSIGKVGYLCATFTFIVIVIRIIVEYTGGLPCGCMNLVTCERPDVHMVKNKETGKMEPKMDCEELDFGSIKNRVYTELLKTVITAITVIVVAIPEGLPLAVTIALSFASAKMQNENNLVRKLASAETMGQVTHICSDKTGTLTQNEMTTMTVLYNNKSYKRSHSDPDDKIANEVFADATEHGTWDLIVNSIMWNSTAAAKKNPEFENDPVKEKEMIIDGNVTECGIFKFFLHKLRFQGIIDAKAALTDDMIQVISPFDSEKKKGGIAVKIDENTVRFFSKGAPDFLFSCVEFVQWGDEVVGWNDVCTKEPEGIDGVAEGATNKEVFEAAVEMYAKQAYRTILACYKDIPVEEFEQLKADNGDFKLDSDRGVLDEGLTAICLFGLQDPLRKEIVGAIQQTKNAGITTIMCTGDNITTAVAISKNAGIVTDEWINQNEDSKLYSCMTGKQFREKVGEIVKIKDKDGKETDSVGNVKEFEVVKNYLRVLGRSSPDDKYLLVTGLQQSYHGGEGLEESKCSVAVTGDGTNDAPALSKANVGFGMGCGTDVARNACDIVLIDDNFKSIITALKYGRSIYDNVRMFLQFQLTVNIVAMFIVFFGSFILNDSPLTPVQMLWVNLIMDTLAALALASEPPDASILDRKPQPSDESIVTIVMWRNVWGHGIYQIIVLVLIMFLLPEIGMVEKYDIRCFKRDNDGNCKEGSFNPYFTQTHYWSKETKLWWEKQTFTWTDYDAEMLAKWQCWNLREDYGHKVGKCGQGNWEQKCSEFRQKSIKDVQYKDLTKEGHPLITWRDPQGKYLPTAQREDAYTQKLIHLTILFQAFVFMQVFNQINARKLKDGEFNIFSGFFANKYFIGVTIFTIAIQWVLVLFAGRITKTYPLHIRDNLVCLAIGAGELIWGVIVKLLPLKCFGCFAFNEKPMTEEEEGKSMMAMAKKGTVRKGPKDKYKNSIQQNMEKQLKTMVDDEFKKQIN